MHCAQVVLRFDYEIFECKTVYYQAGVCLRACVHICVEL